MLGSRMKGRAAAMLGSRMKGRAAAMSDRCILHVDCNSFYASVEQAEDPKLRGLPVAVAGKEELRHGIILTKSTEAKAYGVKTAEAIWEARKKCPSLVVLPPNFALYKRYSEMARDIYCQYTDRVEPFGLDECWLDLTGTLQLFGGDVRMVAEEISERVKAELGITVSIGIGWDKITAKFGSDYRKPDAITEINRKNYQDVFWGAPVEDLLYVGSATKRKLNASGIFTIGGLARASDCYLKRRFGKVGFYIRSFARGEDASPVKAYDPGLHDVARSIKSYGNGLTAPHDITSPDDARALVYLLAESVGQRLRGDSMRAHTVCIGVRDGATLEGFGRQVRLYRATASTGAIAKAAWELLLASHRIDADHPIRAITVRVTGLEPLFQPMQLPLFPDEALERERLDFVIDDLRRRFGNTVVTRGTVLLDKCYQGLDIKEDNTVHPVGFFHV
jgi:DNA polymerase-4